MTIFHSMNTTSSALTAQRMRMDIISSNMANVDSTRGANGEPYRRKLAVLQPKENGFSSFLDKAIGKEASGDGVKIARIAEDTRTPLKLVYDPEHPDAGKDGYVRYPNVDPLREMVDLVSATRSYEANVTVFNASKGMMMKALEIGK
ncbi:flagellar basal body rod protein FlgC [Bacillus massilinigeriensis]|uniref:flagellar basal body rod protein FlgC n=1 Tax=Bacillus mediterraneensis TaxID=1805474 RepID=UPI0008F91367|nr:flagellar basal body rod protein FlgC [Bacillus mediterraneensis]